MLQTRWILPSSFSDYVVMPSEQARHEKEGKNVPVVFLKPLLDTWLASPRARALHEIYEHLGGARPFGHTVCDQREYEHRLKRCLEEAFRRGTLVALEFRRPEMVPLSPTLLSPRRGSGPSRSETAPGTEAAPEPELTFIDIRLVNKKGDPVPHARYRLTLSDGSVREGVLNEHGQARESYVVPGECKVSFPDVEGAVQL